MQLSTFQDQVRRSEVAFRARPDVFSREAAWWAAAAGAWVGLGLLGGSLLFGIGMAGLLGGSADVFSLLGAVGLAGLGASALAAALVPLGVRLPEPEGLPLARSEAPGLFEGLERLAQTFQSQTVHEVRLSTGFEARVVQRPRWGLIGPRRNTLVIGLPLLMAVERRRLLALVALATVVLRGRPERFTARIVLHRSLVQRLAEQLAHDHRWVARPAQRFFAWLAPRLLARTQPLARHEVVVADRLVSKRIGADIWEAALKESALKKAWMEQAFWPWLWLRAQRHEAPKGPLRALKRKLIEPLPAAFARNRLAALWRQEGGDDDAEPGLRARLQAQIPHAQRLLPSPSPSAAAKLVEAAALQRAIEHFDRDWGQHNSHRWQVYRETLARWRERQSRLAHQPRNADEDWELAHLTQALDPRADVRGPLMAALAQRPQYPGALKSLAQALLPFDPSQSLALTERLFETSPADQAWAAARLVDALEHPVRDVEALRHWRLQQATVLATQARIEAQLNPGEPLDHTVPADLNPLERDELLQALRRQPTVQRAWLARKVLPEFPWLRAYVLVLDLPSLDRLRAQAFCDELSRLEGLLPGPCRAVPVQAGFNPLQDPLIALDLLHS